MITGVDLIQEQIRVAQGEKLRFTQEDIKFTVNFLCTGSICDILMPCLLHLIKALSEAGVFQAVSFAQLSGRHSS
jgi:biotin carboxylase